MVHDTATVLIPGDEEAEGEPTAGSLRVERYVGDTAPHLDPWLRAAGFVHPEYRIVESRESVVATNSIISVTPTMFGRASAEDRTGELFGSTGFPVEWRPDWRTFQLQAPALAKVVDGLLRELRAVAVVTKARVEFRPAVEEDEDPYLLLRVWTQLHEQAALDLSERLDGLSAELVGRLGMLPSVIVHWV